MQYKVQNKVQSLCSSLKQVCSEERSSLGSTALNNLLVGMAQVPAIPHTSIPDAPATSDCLEAWNFVRNRRRKCQEHHKVCTAIQSARKPWTPPRLLQLLPDGLRLVETSDLGDICPYVALSYCWGLGESLCTTSESIDDFKRGIPSRDLPSGIKDAVAFTREMSLTWLWIDRFCILQDSQNDWAMNSALMASIYGQADVVVSAVAPSSVFEPFLGDFARGGRIVTPSIAISLNSHADADVLHLRMRCHPWSIIPTKYTRALDTRGWTFQERFLATRCVRYEQHQITWECATEFISIIDPPLRHEPIWKWRRSDAVSAEQWLDIVNEYSSRHLTYAADRLPAISGVAAKFYEVLRCRYFAGLWESSLLHGLQWCSLGFPGSKAMISLILSSPMATVPEAPSWSWASCQTGAMYFTKSRPVEDIAKILHVSCEPSTNNPFGSVKPGATLTIEAPCENTELKLIISSGENDSDTPLKWALTSYESDPSYSAIISMDDPLELHPDASAPQEDIKAFTHFTSMTSWQRAQFKRLVTLKEGMKAEVKLLYTSRKVGDFTALVLTQDPEDPSFYRRIGVVKWLGEWEKRRDRKTAVIETLKIK